MTPRDSGTPSDANAQQIAIEAFWDKEPCDSENSDLSPYSVAYFKEIENERYRYQGHILEILDAFEWPNKRVLEIGTGVGTDARQMIMRGAAYAGINVDAGSVALTDRALRLFGLRGEVRKANATNIPFPDSHFDIAYSFGVLHHIPEVRKVIREIKRVLKPGGQLVLMLYNRDSINYQIEIRYLRKLVIRLLAVPGLVTFISMLGFPKDKIARHFELYQASNRISDEEWLSRNTDGPDNPYSRVYDEQEARELVEGFDCVTSELHYFDCRHWGVLGRFLPRTIVAYLGKHWGWHRVVYATKPVSAA